MRGQRHPCPHVTGDLPAAFRRTDPQLSLAHRFNLKIEAGKPERRARFKAGREALFHPPERLAVAEADANHLAVHNDPGIQAMAGSMLRMGQPPQLLATLAIPPFGDPLKPVIGPQRIAAGCNEPQNALPGCWIDPTISLCTLDLRQQIRRVKGAGAGAGHDMLGQNIQATRPERLAIALTFGHGLKRGEGLEKFEPVARGQHRAARLVKPVIGPPDPLQQARGALGCSHLHHQVNIAPVHPEIEAGGADQRAQLARCHRAFHLASRLHGKRAMMDADRQVIRIGVPQFLEDELGE